MAASAPSASFGMFVLSPIAPYALGTAFLGSGLLSVFAPRKEHARIGLPLESCTAIAPSTADPARLIPSPLVYFKGIREITYGLLLLTLQQQGNEDGVTAVAAVLSLAKFGDGLVVWFNGGDDLRGRALGHWLMGASFLGWVFWRWSV